MTRGRALALIGLAFLVGVALAPVIAYRLLHLDPGEHMKAGLWENT